MLSPKQIETICQEITGRKNVAGILLCGSYVYGHPTDASDLDIRAITDDGTGSNERDMQRFGTRIELFVNPPEQILRYFEECVATSIPHAVHFWAHGQIILDRTGIASDLQRQARDIYRRGPRTGTWQHKEKWAGREPLKRDW